MILKEFPDKIPRRREKRNIKAKFIVNKENSNTSLKLHSPLVLEDGTSWNLQEFKILSECIC